MKRQMLKGFTMVMLVAALALVTVVASANGQSRSVRANIPFEFIIGDKTLAAGNYQIAAATASGEVLRIRNATAKDGAMRLTAQLGGESKQAKLVFHRYGERYFLVEVWAGEGHDGVALLQSKQEQSIERELAMTNAKKDTAQAKYERVEILATLQ
jgi:hypothetical protein